MNSNLWETADELPSTQWQILRKVAHALKGTQKNSTL